MITLATPDIGGYTRSLLRVDLSAGTISRFAVLNEDLRLFVGGPGLGALLLYQEVPPGIEWSDPANRPTMVSGPLGGPYIPGCGTFSVVTN